MIWFACFPDLDALSVSPVTTFRHTAGCQCDRYFPVGERFPDIVFYAAPVGFHAIRFFSLAKRRGAVRKVKLKCIKKIPIQRMSELFLLLLVKNVESFLSLEVRLGEMRRENFPKNSSICIYLNLMEDMFRYKNRIRRD